MAFVVEIFYSQGEVGQRMLIVHNPNFIGEINQKKLPMYHGKISVKRSVKVDVVEMAAVTLDKVIPGIERPREMVYLEGLL